MCAKRKLKKFAEISTFDNVIEPPFNEVFKKDHHLKGKWNSDFFKNDHPIVLELGCGKGEYTIGLASQFPDKNFLGVDIKGARIWRGAKTAIERNLTNVGFLRTSIEFIQSFFEKGEVDEIWITFPDPQLKRRRRKKRLTSILFLNFYNSFLKDNGLIHLKTDSQPLYKFTHDLISLNKMDIEISTNNLYETVKDDKILEIKTYYESLFLAKGMPITYIRFRLPVGANLIDLPEEYESE